MIDANTPLERLMDDRQRLALADYLYARPLVAEEFLHRQEKTANNNAEPEHRRAMARKLIEFLSERLEQMKRRSDRAYAEHRSRRERILGSRHPDGEGRD